MSIGEITSTIGRIANGLPISEITDTEAALTEIIASLSITLRGVEDGDAISALAEARAAVRELAQARTELHQVAAGCRGFLSALGH